ncbi:MAG TPA: PilN domain-containing protein [Gemmatimonadales bacterium]|nr:PilN domain-containing protein [Gemmatimonadales bacterium]
MITINLKPGAKRTKAGPGFADALAGLKTLPSRIKDPWPMAAVVTWVAVAGFLGWVWIGSAVTMGRLESELAAKRAEHRRNRVALAEKRRAEAARDSVVTQIATIRLVDGDRYVWPHILDEVARTLPPYTWLTDLQPTGAPVSLDTAAVAPAPVAVQIMGRTMDIGAFTRFMRQLEDSPWLNEVTVISTGTEIDHGRAVTVFTLKASYVRAKPETRPVRGD